MVMAQVLNTQYVAHEFVRQYYTVLHKDPSQLHRFYTRESRLTHGVSPNAKSEDPVCGQEAINEKISQLHFRSCHAKIRSVDSHPTIGGGVVIQVTGELSNAGMPMRKFMQTFVLAQQEPKKYHVYNDIFRYQDDTFEDTVEETENEEAYEGTVESENDYSNNGQAFVGQMHGIMDEHVVPRDDTPSNANLLNGDDDFTEEEAFRDSEKELEANNSLPANDMDMYQKITEQDPATDSPQEIEEFSTPVQTPTDSVVDAVESEVQKEIVDDGSENKLEKDSAELSGAQELESTVEEPSKPFTWAALAKKNTNSSSTPAASVASTTPTTAKPTQKKPEAAALRATTKKRDEPAFPRKETFEEPRRRNVPPPDSHQIFIGNLPNNVTEKDVREVFKEFGNVVEVRLNPKNFGFVAFDGPDAPNTILVKNKAIIINNHTINTEVKRSVSGSGRGGGGGGGAGGGFRRGDRDSNRNRNDSNKSNRNTSGGQNRPGKNSTISQKQPRNDESKQEKNKDLKFSTRDQRSSRR